LAPLPDGLPRLPLDVLALDRLALVVRLLPAREADLDLDLAVLEVGLQGHEGVALLAHLAAQLVDLAAVEEELAVAALGVVLEVAVAVGPDAAADQEQLPPPQLDERVAEVQPALADALHLRAHQGDAGLRALEDLVVEEGLPVGGDHAARVVAIGHVPS